MSKLTDTKDWTFDRKAGGRRLKALMEQRGVTQEELSEATGVPPTLISRLWWGATEKPDLGMMVKVYGAFGLSPNRAAEDYGIYHHVAPLDDPRIEDARTILRSLDDQPELQEELTQRIFFAAQVFLQQHKLKQE